MSQRASSVRASVFFGIVIITLVSCILTSAAKAKASFGFTQKNINVTNKNSDSEIVNSDLIIKFKKKLKTAADGSINSHDTGLESINKRNLSEKTLAIDSVFSKGKVDKSRNTKAEKRGLDRIYRLKFAGTTKIDKILEGYRHDPTVEYVQPNYKYKIAVTTPNDFYFQNQWGLDKVSAQAAWDITTGTSSVLVAVVDTGIDYNHPDLSGNVWSNLGEYGLTQIGDLCWTGVQQNKKTNHCDDDNDGLIDDWRGWNFVSNSNETFDDNGHGTHVSGIISARGNNGLGVAGLSWSSKLMPLKVFDETGSGSSYDAALAIRYAADHGARIINNSWGAENVQDDFLKDAIDYAHDLGVFVVAAAGNNSQDTYSFSPANIAAAVTVSATDSSDELAYFSNRGAKVDVAAPGDTILSTYPSNSYRYLSGTSMAAPFVSGLAALIMTHNPNLTNEQVRQVIRSSSDDLGGLGGDAAFGAGRINASSALAMSVPPIAYISSPTTAGLELNSLEPIMGSAYGSGFVSYNIEYGAGTNPTSWTIVATSSIGIQNSQLGILDTQLMRSGSYVMRLTVNDTQGKQYQFYNYFDVLTNPTVPQLFSEKTMDSSINLSWATSSAQFSVAGYEIYRSVDIAFSSSTISSTSNNFYNDTSYQNPATYYYKVRAFDNQNPKRYSDFTNVLTVAISKPWWLKRVSTKTGGAQKITGASRYVSAPSTDGRYVAFSDAASDLVTGDTNGKVDIFLKDNLLNSTVLVSVNDQGTQANCNSDHPTLSADGRYVAFESCATNLVAGDINSKPDMFVKDLQLGTITLVSNDSGGVQNPSWTGGTLGSISANGRFVTFTSSANNGKDGIYVKDLVTSSTTLVSSNSSGVAANAVCYESAISADGRYVVFDSSANNLTADAVSTGNVYFKDLLTNVTELISIGSDDGLYIGSKDMLSVSESGRYVAFVSSAQYLVAGETADASANIYLRDRQMHMTKRISKAFNGGNSNGTFKYYPKLSADGRYLSFLSDADNLTADDSNHLIDLFVFDASSSVLSNYSVNLFGGQSSSKDVAAVGDFSYDGKYFSFVSRSDDLLPSDSNNQADVFMRTTGGNPGPLQQLIMSPLGNQNIEAGQSLQFTVAAQDEFGADIMNADIAWSGADRAGKFATTTPGLYHIQASSGGIESSTTLITVTPAIIDHINISPMATQTVMVRQTVQFSAQGQDQYNNDISNLSYLWLGADQSGLFRAAVSGSSSVVVSSGGKNSPAVDVIVTPIPVENSPVTGGGGGGNGGSGGGGSGSAGNTNTNPISSSTELQIIIKATTSIAQEPDLVVHMPVNATSISPNNILASDGLSSAFKKALGLDPSKKDTDGDGISDKDELIMGSNPSGRGNLGLDNAFAKKQLGMILLDVENRGEAWYVNPLNLKRYYLGRPNDAFTVMRALGLGVTHQVVKQSLAYPTRLLGRIIIDVEDMGRAYYINPQDKKSYFLGRPNDAFNVMRQLGLGVKSLRLSKIWAAIN